MIATFGLVLCAGMAAGAFPADWTNSDLITIEEHSGSELTDYQIPVELNASNFNFTKAQPDGADIRFAELGGTMLSHWIEAWNSTDENATVWVKVGSVPANGTATIRMWYGNAGAADASDGDAVFELFNVLGIVAFWHLDEDSWSGVAGEVKDETGVNDGTANNGAKTTAEGRFKRAGSFDGSDDFVDCGNDESLDITDEITIEAWMKPTTSVDGDGILSKSIWGYPEVGGYALALSNRDPKNEVYFRLDGVERLYSGSFSYNKWIYVAATYDGSNMKIYLDGSISNSKVTSGSIFINDVPLVIGKFQNVFNGTIDEVRIYNRALSAEEIAKMYNNYTEKMGSYYNVRAYTSPAPTITISSGNPTTSHIHIDGKNCVNMPFVARLTDTLGNPIASGTIIYSLGGAQFVKTTDVSGYSTFTPTTTGTLLAIYGNESVTCEIIDDPTLCTGGCNFGTDPQADDLAITSFTTDKTTYAGGETMTITIAVLNLGGEMYKKLLIDTSSTKSDTGLPLGFVGSWSFVDLGSSTYEMRLYIPTSTDPGTYNVAGGMYTDYLADGGSILDIASPVSVTIT